MNLPFKAGDVRNEGLIPGSGIPAVEVATHSSMRAWKIPWTKEPGGSPWGQQRVR